MKEDKRYEQYLKDVLNTSPKVLLIRPPQLFYFGVWPRGPRLSIPVGLLSVASFLESKNIDVSIYDCFVEGSDFKNFKPVNGRQENFTNRWVRYFEDGGITSEERDKVNTDSNGNKQLEHFGADWTELSDYLSSTKPDIIGITNLFRENTEETIKCADLIRSVLPGAIIVVGGPNATALPEYMLEKSEAIDFVSAGDGEYPMAEIVEWRHGKRKIESISGIVFRGFNEFVQTSSDNQINELDHYGHINYNLIKLERYFAYERAGIMSRNKFDYNGSERAVSIVTSRGCPYKCSFCSIHIHAGRKFRRYSVDHTLDHIENLVKDFNVRHIHFEDDNLTLDKERFKRLSQGILDRGLKFTWDTPNGVFANTLDEEMLTLMKLTGCIYLVVGVESGDQWVLDNVIYKQPLTIDHVINAFKLGKKVGIDMHAFYIIGFPRETLKNIKTTLNFAINSLKEYDITPHIALARADPGTSLFKEAKESGTLVSDYSLSNAGGVHIDYFVRHLIKTQEFTPEDLERLNESYHKKSIRIIAQKTILFLMKHPYNILTSSKFFLKSLFVEKVPFKDSLIKLFFCRLFYRNALLRIRPN